jgi:hypothetical protein
VNISSTAYEMDLDISKDQQMKQEVGMTALEKEVFNGLRALAKGRSSSLDENKLDDTAAGDHEPTLASIHTFRRALYDTPVCCCKKSPKLAAKLLSETCGLTSWSLS